jgi:hypothetical protein
MTTRIFQFEWKKPDLWCPFCGEQIYKNGIKNEENHYISDDIVEDTTKQKTIIISCKNRNDNPYMTIEIRIKP